MLWQWKHFPCSWPFVREIHKSLVNSPHKGPVTRGFLVSFDVRQNRMLNKQWSHQWFDMPWHLCDITVMFLMPYGISRGESQRVNNGILWGKPGPNRTIVRKDLVMFWPGYWRPRRLINRRTPQAIHSLAMLRHREVNRWLMLQNEFLQIDSFKAKPYIYVATQIAQFMGPTWGPPGSCRPHIGPMNLAIRETRPPLVQIMVYGLFCTKPLLELMLV